MSRSSTARRSHGWHVSAQSGHSGASKNKSGGRWVVEDGAIVGSQDIPGNGGIVITDKPYGNFEVALEMNNDFVPDSGLFLRSTEKGQAYQYMIDYHADGNLAGIYGEGLSGGIHLRNFDFTDKVTEIKAHECPFPLPVKPADWPNFWKHGQWNELRARIVGNPPKITTWINGVRFMEFEDTEKRHPDTGGIALQVHGGGDSDEAVRPLSQHPRQVAGPIALVKTVNARRLPHADGANRFPVVSKRLRFAPPTTTIARVMRPWDRQNRPFCRSLTFGTRFCFSVLAENTRHRPVRTTRFGPNRREGACDATNHSDVGLFGGGRGNWGAGGNGGRTSWAPWRRRTGQLAMARLLRRHRGYGGYGYRGGYGYGGYGGAAMAAAYRPTAMVRLRMATVYPAYGYAYPSPGLGRGHAQLFVLARPIIAPESRTAAVARTPDR